MDPAAGKPHPDREIPQAQSAHDTFWDFVSLHTEATHHTIWNMSDRGIPRSFRMMEGFGVHTFRLVDGRGDTTLVKFHWKPKAGVHSLVWEEEQLINGTDPDFHRRDLADAIEVGNFPQWELGIQTFPDTPDQTFVGIDLLDPTKLVPEEIAPVRPIGLMTLKANPTNYGQVLPPGRQGARAPRTRQHRPVPVRAGRARPRPVRAAGLGAAREPCPQPGAVPARPGTAHRRPCDRDRH
ncbi:Catalase KatE-intracellular protease (EC [Kitasatospora purpeofusca]